jgi:hypothetical protein
LAYPEDIQNISKRQAAKNSLGQRAFAGLAKDLQSARILAILALAIAPGPL